MAIQTLSGFTVGSQDPIDSRIVLTRSQMSGMNDNLMPDTYLAVCKDDGKLYLYNRSNTKDYSTGRFRLYEGGSGEGGVVLSEYPDYTRRIIVNYALKQQDAPDQDWDQGDYFELYNKVGIVDGSNVYQDGYFGVSLSPHMTMTNLQGHCSLLINGHAVSYMYFGSVNSDGVLTSQGLHTGLYRIRPGDTVTIVYGSYSATYKPEYQNDKQFKFSLFYIPVVREEGQGSGTTQVVREKVDYDNYTIVSDGVKTINADGNYEDIYTETVAEGQDGYRLFAYQTDYYQVWDASFDVYVNNKWVFRKWYKYDLNDDKDIEQRWTTPLIPVYEGDVVKVKLNAKDLVYKQGQEQDTFKLQVSTIKIPITYEGYEGGGSGCCCIANPEVDNNTPYLNSISISGQPYKIGGTGGGGIEEIDWGNTYAYILKYNPQYYSGPEDDSGMSIQLTPKQRLWKAFETNIDAPSWFYTVLRIDYSHLKKVKGRYIVYVNNKATNYFELNGEGTAISPASGWVKVGPDDIIYVSLLDYEIEWVEGYQPPRDEEMFHVLFYSFPIKQGQGGGSGSGSTVIANPDDATQSDPAITSIKIDGQNYKIEGGGGTEPDLTNYIQKSDTAGLVKNDGTIDTSAYITAAEIPEIPVIPQNVSYFTNDAGYTTSQDLQNKVDKVDGKGLSAEDFTTELKFKLENMSEHGEENMIDAIEFNGEAVPVSNKVAQITYTPPVRPEFAYTIMNYDENDQYTIARTKHNCGYHPFVWCWSGNNLVQASVIDNIDGDITVKWNNASLVTPENPLYVFFMNLNCEMAVEPKTKYRLDEIPYLAFVDNSTSDNHIGAVGKNSTTNTTCPPDLIIPTKVVDNGIEYTVTKINSFASMTRLKSVVIPDTVTSYTNRNFQGCSNLEEVRLSTSNTGIQFAMFQECPKLRTINLDHITNIQDQAFLQCYELEMEDIPPLCTKIGNSAFSSCYKIGPVLHIPRTMVSISAGAFGYNPQLTAVYIPDNGLSLGQNVFRSCENVQIYCEATEKPSNWNANCFQYIDEATQVHYGCTLDY